MNLKTLGRLTSAALLAGLMVGSLAAAGAETNEKMTGLPLHAGLSFQQEVDSFVCGKKASMNIYDAPFTASLEEYMAWHKQQLKDFHHVHKVWSERAQEMFYSPDGSKGITITATPDGKRVFAVTYIKLSGNLTTHQEDTFDPSNPSCK
ncbi:MAG TPA: hypothetical protein VGG04_04420 [Candidatus Sulfotelmatobacter sp.]|jgi:hypothetical protein